MSAPNFRKGLQDGLLALLQPAVPEVVTWDVYLHELLDNNLFPYVIIYVKQVDVVAPGEIAVNPYKELNKWSVEIYYLDITKETESYSDGERRRDSICHTIQYTLEKDPRLGGIRVPYNELNSTEYIYTSNFSDIVFDSSGQEQYYTFISELYLDVFTAKN